MYAFLLAILTVSGDSNVALGLPPVDEPGAADIVVTPVEHSSAAFAPATFRRSGGSLNYVNRPRAHRLQPPILRRYSASQQYYQSRPYDPRLRFDYPWHAPRVVQPVAPALMGDPQ